MTASIILAFIFSLSTLPWATAEQKHRYLPIVNLGLPKVVNPLLKLLLRITAGMLRATSTHLQIQPLPPQQSGSTSLHEFFKCVGLKSNHWYCTSVRIIAAASTANANATTITASRRRRLRLKPPP
jgi:hypothetical protein